MYVCMYVCMYTHTYDLHATASDIHSFADDSTLNKSSFKCQLPPILVLSLVLLYLQPLTQICRAFLSGEPAI